MDVLSNRSLGYNYIGQYLNGLEDAQKALQSKKNDAKLLYRAAKNSASLSKELYEKSIKTIDKDV